MSKTKEHQRLVERLVTNKVEKYLLEELASNPFSDVNVPTSVREISEKTGIDSSEITRVFLDYKVYGMEILTSDNQSFIRITN